MRRLFATIAVLILSWNSPAGADPLPETLWREPVAALAKAGTLEGVEVTDGGIKLAAGGKTGTFTTAERAVPPINRAVVSWNVRGPKGARVELLLRAKVVGGEWTPWALMGWWEGGRNGSKKDQKCDTFDVDEDTLVLPEGKLADRLQVRAVLTPDPAGAGPVLSALVTTFWKLGQRAPLGNVKSPAWGKTIEVKPRSQMVEDKAIRGSICSATSTAQVLAYWGIDYPTAKVCDGVKDYTLGIWGNWPCNTAFAAEADPSKIREAYVVKFNGFEEVEPEIAAGRPVIVSHKWQDGDISNAPIPKSAGHLIVLVGFTADGDCVVNDPAANPEKNQEVRRVYKRAELYKTWFERAHGVGYVILPNKS